MSVGLGPVARLQSAAGDQLPERMRQVEERMQALAGGDPVLSGYAQATLAAGGKRLRPLLVFLAAGVPAPEGAELLAAATAVELVHSATLVHDDVLDGSDLRRGEPTVVALGGRLMATATGDLLLARAFRELAGAGSPPAVRILSRAAAELAEGELMQRADAFRMEVSVERYLERCRLKTAVLFRAACELGALAGGGPVALLGDFGERIGLAFQLLDDVLDVTGPPERTGKPRGTDLLDGTVTLPLILAGRRDPALGLIDLRQITDAGSAAEVADRIEASGALADVRRRALDLVTAARALTQELPDGQRRALELVADGVVERYR